MSGGPDPHSCVVLVRFHDRYRHAVICQHSFIVDPVTRDQLNLMRQCISVKVVEGRDKAELLREKHKIDDKMDALVLRYRQVGVRDDGTTAVRGFFEESELAGTNLTAELSNLAEALKILMPSVDVEDKKVVVLGAAGSGKSCLMRRLLVTSAEKIGEHCASDFVPVLILLIDLGRLMSKQKLRPEKHDLFLEHVKSVHGEHSARFKMLARCWAERRVLLLLDGLDEAGDQKAAIEKWIAQTLARDPDQRLVVSSRQSGFDEAVFEDFKFVLIMPLSQETQEQVVSLRLRDSGGPGAVAFVQRQLKREAYLEMAKNSLMLSLLIAVLGQSYAKSQADADADADADAEKHEGGEAIITRTQLFGIAFELMLHKNSSNKVKMRRDIQSVIVEKELSLLASMACTRLLEQLAIDTHHAESRDIQSKDALRSLVTLQDAPEQDTARRAKGPEVVDKGGRHAPGRLAPLLCPTWSRTPRPSRFVFGDAHIRALPSTTSAATIPYTRPRTLHKRTFARWR